ncbi:MAG: HU family DNA-binding protein [Chlamydiae bacterium]|nr:HU family DNA-binding protein [Chlamydiota bacterium]MBI3277417.1 HU family DNA-binding protein [Chlamydiota bacterium]
MNKAELVETIVKNKNSGIPSKAAAEKALDSVLTAIRTGLKKDKTVQLIGFGNFMVKNRKARKGINPKTGEQIQIKASRSVGFRPGKALKASV